MATGKPRLRVVLEPEQRPRLFLPGCSEPLVADCTIPDSTVPLAHRLGLAFTRTSVVKLNFFRFIAALVLAHRDGERSVTLDALHRDVWPGRRRKSFGNELPSYCLSRRRLVDECIDPERCLVQYEEITFGPYRLNTGFYEVDADNRALRAFLRLGEPARFAEDVATPSIDLLLQQAADLEAEGSTRRACHLYVAILATQQSLSADQHCSVLARLSAAELRLGLSDRALAHARQLCEVATRAGLHAYGVDGEHRAAIAQRQRAEFERALRLDRTAWKRLRAMKPALEERALIRRAIGILLSLGETLSLWEYSVVRANEGSVRNANSRWRQATEYLNKADAMAQQLGEPALIARVMRNKARHRSRQRDWKEAHHLAAHVNELREVLGIYDGLVWEAAWTGILYMRADDAAQAAEAKNRLENVIEQLARYEYGYQLRLAQDTLSMTPLYLRCRGRRA